MDAVSIIIIAAWGAVLVLRLAEAVGTGLFATWIFADGPRVITRRVTLPRPVAPAGTRLDTPDGLAKLVEPDLCLIRARPRWFKFGSSLYGSVRWKHDGATFEARVPWGFLATRAAWFFVTLAISAVWFQTGSLAMVWPYFLLGVVVACAPLAIFLLDLSRSRKRFSAILDELDAEFSAACPTSASS